MIKSYRDLEAWKKSRALVKAVYILTRKLPKEEIYALTQQIRRAVVSVPANIAEGHSRHGAKDFASFVSIAIGSLAELDTLLTLSNDLEYITETDLERISLPINEVQRILHGLRKALKANP